MGETLNYGERITKIKNVNPFIGQTELVHRLLLEDILLQHRRPGSYINQEELLKQLGVSRSPVRDAIHQLEKENYLIKCSKQGYFVYIITPKDALRLIEYRSAIEIACGRLAARRSTQKDFDLMKQNLQKLQDHLNGNHRFILDLDTEFHNLLVLASKNECFINAYRLYAEKFAFLRNFTVFANQHCDILLRHENIFNELLKRNQDGVERAIQEHLDNLLEDGISVNDYNYG